MKSLEVVAFVMVILAGIIAAPSAPLATVLAFVAAALFVAPIWKRKGK